MKKEDVLKFIRNTDFDSVKHLGQWNGFDIWEPVFEDNEDHCIGFPLFILAKDNSLRWSKDWEESLKIMNIFYPSDDDEETGQTTRI